MLSELELYQEKLDTHPQTDLNTAQWEAFLKLATSECNYIDKEEVIFHLQDKTGLSWNTAQDTLEKMACLEIGNKGIGMKGVVSTELHKGEVSNNCYNCAFGPLSSTEQVCEILRRQLANRVDIRKTSKLVGVDRRYTHYGIEKAKQTKELTLRLMPNIQNAVLDFVDGFDPTIDNVQGWENCLTDNLWQPMVEDLGFIAGRPDKDGDKGRYFWKIWHMLSEDFGDIDTALIDSPWLPLLREYGINTGIKGFVRSLQENFPSLSTSDDIKEFMYKEFYGSRGDDGKRERDDFRTNYSVGNNGQKSEGAVYCPGRVIALSACFAIALNTNLKSMGVYSRKDQGYVPIYKEVEDGRRQTLGFKEMKDTHGQLLASRNI